MRHWFVVRSPITSAHEALVDVVMHVVWTDTRRDRSKPLRPQDGPSGPVFMSALVLLDPFPFPHIHLSTRLRTKRQQDARTTPTHKHNEAKQRGAEPTRTECGRLCFSERTSRGEHERVVAGRGRGLVVGKRAKGRGPRPRVLPPPLCPCAQRLPHPTAATSAMHLFHAANRTGNLPGSASRAFTAANTS